MYFGLLEGIPAGCGSWPTPISSIVSMLWQSLYISKMLMHPKDPTICTAAMSLVLRMCICDQMLVSKSMLTRITALGGSGSERCDEGYMTLQYCVAFVLP